MDYWRPDGRTGSPSTPRHKPGRAGTVPRVTRYQLMTKALPGGGQLTSNPAMQRTGNVPMDTGRPWSGEAYNEGAVTDPDSAFAKFTTGPDTEAWLDRNDDGTLIGWVRDGADIYRYSDPEAWALDVDGAQMQRADAGAAAPGDGTDPTTDPAADPNADPNADPAAAANTDPTATGPTAFANEPDPAATAPDPTAQVNDPTNPPATDEYDNPFADLTANDTHEPSDQAATDGQPAEPAATGTDSTDSNGDGIPDAEELDANGQPKKKKRGHLFGGKVQVKHMPGKHNQEDHGNWADGLPHHHFPGHHRPGSSGSGDSSGGAGSHPKAGKPARAPKPTGDTTPKKATAKKKPAAPAPGPKHPPRSKATLSPDTLKHMSNEDLDALTLSDELYDMDTLLAAAQELDSRDDVDARTRGFATHTQPGSPERQALFDAVIPDHWSTWVAQGGKGPKPKKSKRADIEAAYQDFVLAQYVRALNETNGVFFSNAGSKLATANGKDEMGFFDGSISRSEFKRYASEEMARFFGAGGEQRMTFSEYAADFYPSYAKAKAKVGSRYLTEHG